MKILLIRWALWQLYFPFFTSNDDRLVQTTSICCVWLRVGPLLVHSFSTERIAIWYGNGDGDGERESISVLPHFNPKFHWNLLFRTKLPLWNTGCDLNIIAICYSRGSRNSRIQCVFEAALRGIASSEIHIWSRVHGHMFEIRNGFDTAIFI